MEQVLERMSRKVGRPQVRGHGVPRLHGHGGWEGGPCEGAWIYRADGTFRASHYSPAGSRLAGTWEVLWDARPPTLVWTCKTSDDPDLVGKTWSVKLLQLDDKTIACDETHGYPPHSSPGCRPRPWRRRRPTRSRGKGNWPPSKTRGFPSSMKRVGRRSKPTPPPGTSSRETR